MDFWLADEQLARRDTIRALCRQRFDLSNLATREGAAITSAAWQALAGVGVFGLIAPGEPGGAVEAVLAFEQLGAYLAPGPLRWTAITAPLMAGAANGSHRVTGIDCTVNDRAPYIVDHGRESDLVVIVRTDGVTVIAPTDLGEPIGTGCTRRCDATRDYFWSLQYTIAAGTSQIQRNLIAERILGLPRGR